MDDTTILKEGTLLNDAYRIERVLGKGGFGITYLAYDIAGERYVAVKEFFFKDGCERGTDGHTVVVSTAAKKDLIERFRIKFNKEANLIKNLDHHNIIHVYDVFSANDTSYYIMEYIEGETLADVIKARGHLSESESREIIRQVSYALGYLHARKINHLDIKPGNIMLSDNGKRITLIDFGISKQYDRETGEATTTTPVGISHGYSPLEQYHAGGVSKFSPESDIYSMGATLYKMLSGVTPPNAVDIAHTGITDFPPIISPGMRKALSVIMSPRRADRPHTTMDFNKTLDGQPVIEATTMDTDEPDTPEKKNRTALYIAGAVILCLIIGAGIYYGTRGGSQGAAPAVVADTVMADTVMAEVEELPRISVNQMSKSVGESSIEVDFPKCSNEILERNILEWINEQLGGTYEGDLKDNAAMFEHYASQLGGIDEDGIGEYVTTALTKAYEDDYVVTYKDDSYWYGGGVHGMGTVSGRTFRKSDGKIFNNSYIYFDKLRSHAIRGLKKYFDVSTDDELMGQLQIEGSTVNMLPPPTIDPWIMGDGVHFMYAPYEIAPYSWGSPTFTVSIDNIKPAVNATAKTFFK